MWYWVFDWFFNSERIFPKISRWPSIPSSTPTLEPIQDYNFRLDIQIKLKLMPCPSMGKNNFGNKIPFLNQKHHIGKRYENNLKTILTSAVAKFVLRFECPPSNSNLERTLTPTLAHQISDGRCICRWLVSAH